jgi:hypothetical protein
MKKLGDSVSCPQINKKLIKKETISTRTQYIFMRKIGNHE